MIRALLISIKVSCLRSCLTKAAADLNEGVYITGANIRGANVSKLDIDTCELLSPCQSGQAES
jgi:hypothetical protein